MKAIPLKFLFPLGHLKTEIKMKWLFVKNTTDPCLVVLKGPEVNGIEVTIDEINISDVQSFRGL